VRVEDRLSPSHRLVDELNLMMIVTTDPDHIQVLERAALTRWSLT
jgi:hypothetical protein